MPVTYGTKPFQSQVDFFRRKLNVGTRGWTDIWQGQHDRAFMVAGAMKTDLVEDLHRAVDKAIAQGTTLDAFRKDFDAIVQKYGWGYNGGRPVAEEGPGRLFGSFAELVLHVRGQSEHGGSP